MHCLDSVSVWNRKLLMWFKRKRPVVKFPLPVLLNSACLPDSLQIQAWALAHLNIWTIGGNCIPWKIDTFCFHYYLLLLINFFALTEACQCKAKLRNLHLQTSMKNTHVLDFLLRICEAPGEKLDHCVSPFCKAICGWPRIPAYEGLIKTKAFLNSWKDSTCRSVIRCWCLLLWTKPSISHSTFLCCCISGNPRSHSCYAIANAGVLINFEVLCFRWTLIYHNCGFVLVLVCPRAFSSLVTPLAKQTYMYVHWIELM